MKWLQTGALVMTLVLGCQSIFAQTVGEIGMVDDFLGNGPWANWSGQWLALLERDGGFEIREVTVSSTPDENPICGDKGFIVNATSTDSVILLLRGFPGIKAGQVVTAFHDRKFLLPGEWLDVHLGGDAYWGLHAFGTVRPALYGGSDDSDFTDYQVWMTGGGRRALVFSLDHLDSDGRPEILWVGDLDGDRVADIIADVRTHYAGSHYVLFLSSLAGPGQLVAEAGSVSTHGC
ncbi:MAG: hypothetical protein HP491_07570 [Nitrospira sp.]|nr:hypothetical protein [Nitrospira sp.]MBH0181497.1 hypothetical protein [Nitrospira sp.]MBH0186655.1 hypothetical protein [Nitrospira sp.]